MHIKELHGKLLRRTYRNYHSFDVIKQGTRHTMTISHVLCLCAALAASLHFVVASAPRQEEERVKRSDDPAPLEVVVDKLSQQVNTLTAQVAALTDRQTTCTRKEQKEEPSSSPRTRRKMILTNLIVVVMVVVGALAGQPASRRLQKRSDDTDPLEVVVQTLAQQVSSLNAQVTALQSKIDKVVAFHAYESSHPISSTASGPIVLHNVFTNVGDGFDTQTGYFTAPMSGLYQFHANFMSNDFPQYVHAAIMVDQLLVAVGISDSRHSYFDDVGIAAVVHVNAGQRVFLKNVDSRANSYYGGDYTSFSGFLLRAD
ncbi:hypothetical protein BaRGS_00019667 [Batillaria attramentaria]|uniref:C1q domain-containing protein n=1 Tax=Batillaria attramentaria TaxID=370345 RepID=A0ABD0KQ83_9CAEN